MAAAQTALPNLDQEPPTPSDEKLPAAESPKQRPLSPSAVDKIAQIEAACRDQDLDALIHLATTKSGLVEDSLRRTACTFSALPQFFSPILNLLCDRAPPIGIEWTVLGRPSSVDLATVAS